MEIEVSDEKKNVVDNIRRRLRRIEGQLKGIERMIEKDACCMDLLVQISAVRAATSKVGILILQNHFNQCLQESFMGENKDKNQTFEQLMKALENFIK